MSIETATRPAADAAAAAAADAIAYEPTRTTASETAVWIGIVGLRLLAVYYLFQFIVSLPLIWTYLRTADYTGSSTVPVSNILASLGVYAAASLTLLLAARPIARLLFGRCTGGAVMLDAGSWMTIVVAGVGLALIVFNLSEGIRDVVFLAERVNLTIRHQPPMPMATDELLRVVLPLTDVAIGFLLFLRPRLIVGQWTRQVRL